MCQLFRTFLSETRTVVRGQTAQVEALTETVIRFMPSTVTVVSNQKTLKNNSPGPSIYWMYHSFSA